LTRTSGLKNSGGEKRPRGRIPARVLRGAAEMTEKNDLIGVRRERPKIPDVYFDGIQIIFFDEQEAAAASKILDISSERRARYSGAEKTN
jgi:hypothetical protein